MNSDIAESRPHTISIDAQLHGTRLDKALSTALPDYTRSHMKRLIADGAVSIDDKTAYDPAIKVKSGQTISMTAVSAYCDYAAPAAEKIDLDIRYADADLMVIDKPAGLVVHPGAGQKSGTLVNALLHHCGDQLSDIGGPERAGIVHRLDKDTSGLMLVARNNTTHKRLQRALRQRRITRMYAAFVLGTPLPPAGTIDTPFARHPKQRTKYYVPAEADVTTRRAITHYKQLNASTCDTLAHIQCKLDTGRTHQIRVHMAYKGTPVLGDPVYGPSKQALSSALAESQCDPTLVQHIQNLERQALHAGFLSFEHPREKTEMQFESDLPEDINALISNRF